MGFLYKEFVYHNTTKYSHITPVRKSLHWLPIMHRSIFKVTLLVYKFLHSGHPKYFELVSGIATIFVVDYSSIFPTDDRPIINFFTQL